MYNNCVYLIEKIEYFTQNVYNPCVLFRSELPVLFYFLLLKVYLQSRKKTLNKKQET